MDSEGQLPTVCLLSLEAPSGCLGTGTSMEDTTPVQLGQRSKCSNTRGKTTQSHATSVFPLDTGHMLSLGLQTIFRLSFFFFFFTLL